MKGKTEEIILAILVKQNTQVQREKGMGGLNYADSKLSSPFHFAKNAKHFINEVY